MSALPKPYFTLQEYYALDASSDQRWEYWDGEVVCMSGGLEEHGWLASRAHGMLYTQVDGLKCAAFTGEQAVAADTSTGYLYPDACVACSPRFAFHKQRGIDLLTNPIIIIEVASSTTVVHDHNQKFDAYRRANKSLTDYIVVEWNRRHVTHQKRTGTRWRKTVYKSGVIMSAKEIEIDISTLYRGLKVR